MSRKGLSPRRVKSGRLNAVLPYSFEDVQRAMAEGEEPDDVDKFKGKSYLHQCAYFGELEAVEFLIMQHGADITCRTTTEGHSVLRIAVEQKRDDVAAYLVEECLRRDPTGGLLRVLLYNANPPSTLQLVFSNGLLQTMAALSPYQWAALRRQQSRLPLPVDNHQPADHLSETAKEVMDRLDLPWEGRSSVNLIHKRHFVKARRLLPFEECHNLQLHVQADVIGASEKILFVSRCWQAEDLDPFTMNYNTIKLFLEDNPHISYVWVDTMCMPFPEPDPNNPNSQNQQFSKDIRDASQIVLAAFHASELLIIPAIDEDGDTDLMTYRTSGWAQAEFLLCLMRGCQTQITFTAQYSETRFVSIKKPSEDMYHIAGNTAVDEFLEEAETADDRILIDRLTEKWVYSSIQTPSSPRSPRLARRQPRLKPTPEEIAEVINCVVQAVISLDTDTLQKVCSLQLSREDIVGHWIGNMVNKGPLQIVYESLGSARFQNDKADIVLILLFTFCYHMGYFETLVEDDKNNGDAKHCTPGLLAMEEELQQKFQADKEPETKA